MKSTKVWFFKSLSSTISRSVSSLLTFAIKFVFNLQYKWFEVTSQLRELSARVDNVNGWGLEIKLRY